MYCTVSDRTYASYATKGPLQLQAVPICNRVTRYFDSASSNGFVGVQAHVIDAVGVAAGAKLVQVVLDDPLVRGADQVRAGFDLFGQFQAVELHVAGEREVDLVRVQDVEHRHVVTLEPQVLEPLQDGVHFVEHVRDDEHQPPTADAVGELFEQRADRRLFFRVAGPRACAGSC